MAMKQHLDGAFALASCVVMMSAEPDIHPTTIISSCSSATVSTANTSSSSSRIPKPAGQSSHSRSSTEPSIKRSEVFHSARLSIDGSPHTSGTERDTASISGSPPKLVRRKGIADLPSTASRKSHQRKDSGLPKSPSVPTFHRKPDAWDAKSSLPNAILQSVTSNATEPLSAQIGGPFLKPSNNSSSTEVRLPSQRKGPASHSSYGIETSCGPPPSFSTRKTLSQDRLWKPTPPEKLELALSPDASPLQNDIKKSSKTSGSPKKESIDEDNLPAKQESGSPQNHNPPETSSEMAPTAADYAVSILQDALNQKRASDPIGAEEGSKSSTSDDRKSEDLFLNIARDSNQHEKPGQSTIRRPRTSRPSSSSTRPTNGVEGEPTLTLDQLQYDNNLLFPRTDVPSYSKRTSFSRQSNATSAHPVEESRSHRFLGSSAKTTSTSRSTFSRDGSDPSPEYPHTYNRRESGPDSGSRLNQRNFSSVRPNRINHTEQQDRPKLVEHNTTESSISTAAPSTVWDELDDLKSRIRKLELTGKLPPSSAAAMSSMSAERPRTATTNATTMSSSPKYGKASTSPMESAIEGIQPTVHPLLHEALIKARTAVSDDIYQKLEATASDALQLASMMSGSSGSQIGNSSQFGISSSFERQIRRRADSMCRGLTELAIALSAESNLAAPTLRPLSSGHAAKFSSPLSAGFQSRRSSNDPEERSAVSRVQSRLETRRISQLFSNNRTGQSVSESPTHLTPSSTAQTQSMSSSRLNSSSLLLRNRRTQGIVDGAGDSDEGSPSLRPVSRAMTDVSSAARRFSARDRMSLSREYTSQHPMPTSVEQPVSTPRSALPAEFRSGLSSRRISNSQSNTSYSPATPKDMYARRINSARDLSTPLTSAENTPENVTIERGSGSRRSFGLASRIGSTVGSRLRAARAEKYSNLRQQQQQQQWHDTPPAVMPVQKSQLSGQSQNSSSSNTPQAEQENLSPYDEEVQEELAS